VAEAKRAIGVLREVAPFAMDLFVEGKEEPLDDEKRLSSVDKQGPAVHVAEGNVGQTGAGEALFKSCGGAGWHRKGGWMTEAELGEWCGVTLDVRGGWLSSTCVGTTWPRPSAR
jgi:hypothetical protein